ncbi:type IV pilus secretin PilQ [Thiocystis violascens]|uniref:Type IV pilus secretin PilQ/competence protein n=1 Tax=Thiocystis violascens (strain ATCC 17096 / DSM 198 / 6111) TaxID=765911 RepID=I3YCQ0_THIV6|nr:type IV pilus secretin PilQ [Thiocystis violascens]AFL74768.1 type IV pilus secretin PilQ/competence protein [Thiocystis violascens DSM 198]
MISLFQRGRGGRLWPIMSARMTARAHALGLPILLLIIGTQAGAADLTDVQFAALPGSRVEIQLILSGPVAAPETFSTESPARIALDFPGVTSKLASKSVPIGVGPLHSLVAVDASDRTRVVLNLTDSVPYEVSTAGNRVTIQVNTQGSVASAPPEAPPAASPTETRTSQPPAAWNPRARPARSVASGPALRDIDFRGSGSGEGRVVIRLPNPDTRVAVREEGSRVFVDLYDTSLPQRLFRRLDVADFATPVTAIESRPNGRNVEIEVQTEGDFDHMAYQTDELFTLDFRPLTPAEKEDMARQKVVYDGNRLSLNFQDIEVRAVLQVLADFTDRNLVASDSVQGNITLRLKNVPWDQALDIILKTKGLTMREHGNVIMVAPIKEFAEQELLEVQSFQRIEELAQLQTETIPIKYAKAADIAEVIEGTGQKSKVSKSSDSASGSSKGIGKQTSSGNQAGFNLSGNMSGSSEFSSAYERSDSILSFRGSVTSDERTNTLIVQDTRTNIEAIRSLVVLLDVPVRQVMIESRVVIANNDFARDLGVRFGVSGSMGSLGSNELLVAGGQPGSLAVTGFDKGPFGLNVDTGTPYNSGLIDDDDNQTLITNLPALDPSGSINFLLGKVGSYLLQLELSAMQREGRGEIVSSPRVITSDQSKASIKVGQQIPYKTVSESGTQTEFKDAVLQLDVTPHITPDDRVIMELMVSKDSADYTNQSVDGVPINTRSVETNVLVENGETVVLGGVFERQKSFQKEQVPWLGDVPVLGRLFKNEARLDNNSELLIFVTPKILKGDAAVAR